MKKKYLFIFIIIFICLNLHANQKIGLVLSGGGAKGIAHIGVLKVLEEAGIKPDYITGTSMGGIIGGLYAIGYTPKQLENLIKSQNWTNLLLDIIPRNYISISEKLDETNYALRLDMKDFKLQLPQGMVKGQNLSLLLSKLTWAIHHEKNFNNFPIPFACMATDIETGDAVILNKGLLPEALRATMSIPSAFTPVEIDDKLLVDGGVVRNLPVFEAKNMGADFIIGVNVGAPLKPKKELNNLISIMNQAVGFAGEKSIKKAEKACNILIKPNIKGYGITSFNDADSLIARGEKAARKQILLLKKIGKVHKKFNKKIEALNKNDDLSISKVRIIGRKDVSRNLVNAKLNLKIPSIIKLKELENSILRLYSTGFFERVTYSLQPVEDGLQVNIKVVEKVSDKIQLGLVYNSETEAGFIFNSTIRNYPVKGGKLSISTLLSGYPQAKASYFVYTGYKPGIGVGIKLNYRNYETFMFDPEVENKKILSADYYNTRLAFELQSTITHSSTFGVGYEQEFSKVNSVVSLYKDIEMTSKYFTLYGYFIYDTLNRKGYPQKGSYCNFRFKNIKKINGNSYKMLLIKFSRFFKLSSKLSLFSKYDFGQTTGATPEHDHYMLLGGNIKNFENIYSLGGINRFEITTKNLMMENIGLRAELVPSIYLQGDFTILSAQNNFDDLLTKNNTISSYGGKIGWLSPTGPIEFSVYKCSLHKKASAYFKIGYDF